MPLLVLFVILAIIVYFKYLWPLILIIIVAIILYVRAINKAEEEKREAIRYKQETIRRDVYSSRFLYYKDFEARWLNADSSTNGRGRDGFKYQDGPGCYVIVIHRSPVTGGNYKNYENIYIGQSINVCQRVHNHFNGKGNGDIYADIRNGKWVYVQFIRCPQEELNRREKELIAAFNATTSYNRTKGGSAIR